MNRPAECHPDRPLFARTRCKPCYDHHLWAGTLDQFPTKRPQRPRAHFVADYELLRSEGYTNPQIAERLGMKYRTFAAAYARAVAAGALSRDRRLAA